MIQRNPIKDAQHTCDDEDYVHYLSHVINAQMRRLYVPQTDRDDVHQDCMAFFWERDLRASYRTDKGAKFNSWLTTCVYRFVIRRLQVANCKYIDAVRYEKRRKDLTTETDALLATEKLRAVYGDRVIDAMLEQATRRKQSTMSRGTYTTLLKELRDCHDQEAGSE